MTQNTRYLNRCVLSEDFCFTFKLCLLLFCRGRRACVSMAMKSGVVFAMHEQILFARDVQGKQIHGDGENIC